MSLIKGYSIFTKPWKHTAPKELGRLVKELGFNGIEYPLREEFQVPMNDMKRGLKSLAEVLSEFGVDIYSVASSTDEQVFEACAEAKVPLIRIMYSADIKKGYMAAESDMKKDIEKYLPFCERYGVKVGIQQHYGAMVNNSMEMRHLLEGYNPAYVGAIWDAAHSSLAGEEPEQGLDIVWDYLALVNFKAGFYRRVNGPESAEAKFTPYMTTGRNGAFSWRRAVDFLIKKGYDGIICMPAEYTDEANVERYVKEDLIYLRSLFTDTTGCI